MKFGRAYTSKPLSYWHQDVSFHQLYSESTGNHRAGVQQTLSTIQQLYQLLHHSLRSPQYKSVKCQVKSLPMPTILTLTLQDCYKPQTASHYTKLHSLILNSINHLCMWMSLNAIAGSQMINSLHCEYFRILASAFFVPHLHWEVKVWFHDTTDQKAKQNCTDMSCNCGVVSFPCSGNESWKRLEMLLLLLSLVQTIMWYFTLAGVHKLVLVREDRDELWFCTQTLNTSALLAF